MKEPGKPSGSSPNTNSTCDCYGLRRCTAANTKVGNRRYCHTQEWNHCSHVDNGTAGIDTNSSPHSSAGLMLLFLVECQSRRRWFQNSPMTLPSLMSQRDCQTPYVAARAPASEKSGSASQLAGLPLSMLSLMKRTEPSIIRTWMPLLW